jgi:hypothetical protein
MQKFKRTRLGPLIYWLYGVFPLKPFAKSGEINVSIKNSIITPKEM